MMLQLCYCYRLVCAQRDNKHERPPLGGAHKKKGPGHEWLHARGSFDSEIESWLSDWRATHPRSPPHAKAAPWTVNGLVCPSNVVYLDTSAPADGNLTLLITQTDTTYVLAPGQYTMPDPGISFDSTEGQNLGDLCIIGNGATPGDVTIIGASDGTSQFFNLIGNASVSFSIGVKVTCLSFHTPRHMHLDCMCAARTRMHTHTHT